MRIGIFTDQYLPNISGMVTSILNLRQGLEALGHEVYIIAPSRRGYKDSDEHIIRVLSVDPRVFLGNAMAIPTRGIFRRLCDMQFDVIHVQEMFTIGTLGHAVAKRTQRPLIATVHTQWDMLFKHYPTTVIAAAFGVGIGYPLYFGFRQTLPILLLENGGENNALSRQVGKSLVIFANECDAVIAPSLHVQDKLKRFRCKSPVYHIPNAIDLNQPEPRIKLPVINHNSIKVISVGRVSKEKRTFVLIEAFMKLPKYTNMELFIIGDGPDMQACQELVNDFDMSNKIHFLGNLPNDQTKELMCDADLLALVSYRFDNQPMVILEALAAGIGIMYCDDQLLDGLDENNSLLVKHSASGIKDGLYYLALNPGILKKYSARSKSLAKGFSTDRIAKKVEKIYKSLLAGRP